MSRILLVCVLTVLLQVEVTALNHRLEEMILERIVEVPTQVSFSSDATVKVWDYAQSAYTKPCVVVPVNPTWKPIPGAEFIWGANTNTVGSFWFRKSFWLSTALNSTTTTVSIQTSADDYTDINLNGVTIATSVGPWYALVTTDLTPYVTFSSEGAEVYNNLELYATNVAGPGGLAFKVTVNYPTFLKVGD